MGVSFLATKTRLDPTQEAYFRLWFKDWAQRRGMNPDPDARPDYDYRAAWKKLGAPGAASAIGEESRPWWESEDQHWPSYGKSGLSPEVYVRDAKGHVYNTQKEWGPNIHGQRRDAGGYMFTDEEMEGM